MSRIVDTILRHLALVALLAAIVIVVGLIVWLGLAWVGIAVSPLLPVAALAGALAWSIAHEQDQRQPPPPPVAPRRALTEAEVNALLTLHTEGIISAAELRAALGDLLPPGRVGPPSDRDRRERR